MGYRMASAPLGPATDRGFQQNTSMVTLKAVIHFAQKSNMVPDEIANELGLPVQELGNANQLVADDKPAKLMRRLEALGKEPALTLSMAEQLPYSYFGSIEQAACFAPTIGDIMNIFVDYAWLLSSRLVSFSEESAHYVSYHFYHPMGHIDNGMFRELAVSLMWQIVRRAAGFRVGLAEVNLGHTPNGCVRRYRNHFNTPVTFGVFPGSHVLVFRKDVLGAVNKNFNAARNQLGLLAIQQLVNERRKASAPVNLQRLDKAICKSVYCRSATLDDVAEIMNLSRRSVQRVAMGCGIKIRDLIVAKRIEVAKIMIMNNPEVSLGELAYRLGYADLSSFCRAFVKHNGFGVAHFRKLAHQNKPA